MHSYVYSPLPTTGSFAPALSAALRIVGLADTIATAAADAFKNLRRVERERGDMNQPFATERRYDCRPSYAPDKAIFNRRALSGCRWRAGRPHWYVVDGTDGDAQGFGERIDAAIGRAAIVLDGPGQVAAAVGI